MLIAALLAALLPAATSQWLAAAPKPSYLVAGFGPPTKISIPKPVPPDPPHRD